MSEADADRAGRWLYGQRRRLADWSRNGPPDGVSELLDRAVAGVDALESAEVLDAEAAARWRKQFAESAAGQALTAHAPADVRPAAERLLGELLGAVPNEPDWDDVNSERFEGAVEVLGAIGAADAASWDAEFRRRTGEAAEDEEFEEIRRLNAGGTEVELAAVVPGPAERRKGHRLVAMLRFADGVSFLIDKDDARDFEWPDWHLTDDLGTPYMPGGASGSDQDEHVSFRTAVPNDARWIELAHEQDPEIAFRVPV
jgi:hypothetical protein